MHLPVLSRDFTDFSCSKDHVLNAGEAIQKKRYLPPGFLHFPIGYSGRTSSLIVSGTPVVRPKGQFRDAQGEVNYRPTEQLDYELELACIVSKPTKLSESVASKDADDHIFGLVLLNDWSGTFNLFKPSGCCTKLLRSTRHPRSGNASLRSTQREEFRNVHIALDHHFRRTTSKRHQRPATRISSCISS